VKAEPGAAFTTTITLTNTSQPYWFGDCTYDLTFLGNVGHGTSLPPFPVSPSSMTVELPYQGSQSFDVTWQPGAYPNANSDRWLNAHSRAKSTIYSNGEDVWTLPNYYPSCELERRTWVYPASEGFYGAEYAVESSDQSPSPLAVFEVYPTSSPGGSTTFTERIIRERRLPSSTEVDECYMMYKQNQKVLPQPTCLSTAMEGMPVDPDLAIDPALELFGHTWWARPASAGIGVNQMEDWVGYTCGCAKSYFKMLRILGEDSCSFSLTQRMELKDPEPRDPPLPFQAARPYGPDLAGDEWREYSSHLVGQTLTRAIVWKFESFSVVTGRNGEGATGNKGQRQYISPGDACHPDTTP